MVKKFCCIGLLLRGKNIEIDKKILKKNYFYNVYALVDCNNFYASCERVFNPLLQGKPLGILSNNDGCIISRSDEAKALGLPMGAPMFQWEQFCKENRISILSSNYPLYGDMSARVMSILENFTPDVEVYSIDEAFLQFKGFENYSLNTCHKNMTCTTICIIKIGTEEPCNWLEMPRRVL